MFSKAVLREVSTGISATSDPWVMGPTGAGLLNRGTKAGLVEGGAKAFGTICRVGLGKGWEDGSGISLGLPLPPWPSGLYKLIFLMTTGLVF